LFRYIRSIIDSFNLRSWGGGEIGPQFIANLRCCFFRSAPAVAAASSGRCRCGPACLRRGPQGSRLVRPRSSPWVPLARLSMFLDGTSGKAGFFRANRRATCLESGFAPKARFRSVSHTTTGPAAPSPERFFASIRPSPSDKVSDQIPSHFADGRDFDMGRDLKDPDCCWISSPAQTRATTCARAHVTVRLCRGSASGTHSPITFPFLAQAKARTVAPGPKGRSRGRLGRRGSTFPRIAGHGH